MNLEPKDQGRKKPNSWKRGALWTDRNLNFRTGLTAKSPRLNYKIEEGSPEAKHASGPQKTFWSQPKRGKRLKRESEQPFKQKGWEQTHHRSNCLGAAVTELEDAEEDKTETIVLVQLY